MNLARKCFAEFLGTYLLVLFGCGVVHSAVLTGSQSGLWQVAVVWGLAIMLAIYVTGAVSGAHINPAMTLAFAARGRFSWPLVPPYIAAQLVGAFTAAATLFALFSPFLAAREQEKNVVRGHPGSEITAMCYGEYFPSPGPLANSPGPYSEEAHKQLNSMVSERMAFFAEALGTLILALVVFAVTDARNNGGPGGRLAPVFIGLTVSALISVIAPLTQACFNPARDFGPRLFACFAGWGNIALPGPTPTGFLTVYIAAPVVGAVMGGGIYDLLVRPALTVPSTNVESIQPQETQKMSAPQLILVGGFLGAGKTTLLAQAAERLGRQGKRVGLVANDQAADLVDTEILRETGSPVEEVAGGCFCCRFPDMVSAMERLVRESAADVLIGEPVGSCTDLSATVMQPLKKLHGHQFEVAPFSVLIDAKQVRVLARLSKEAESGKSARFADNVLYIYEKQLEEADLIVLNKTDLLSAGELSEIKASLAERFPDTPLLVMSALTGDGVDAWLDFVSQRQAVGRKIAEVDYDTYAAGEAALGWMNATGRLQAHGDIDWKTFASDLLEAIRGELRAHSAEIAHLKLYLTAPGSHVVGNVTSNDGALSVRGGIAPEQRKVSLLINARVQVQPDALRDAVENLLQTTAGDRLEARITNMRSFFPGRPQPTYRYERVA